MHNILPLFLLGHQKKGPCALILWTACFIAVNWNCFRKVLIGLSCLSKWPVLFFQVLFGCLPNPPITVWTLQIKCCRNDIVTFCASLFELKTFCLESPRDHSSATSKRSCRERFNLWILLRVYWWICVFSGSWQIICSTLSRKKYKSAYTHKKVLQQYCRCFDFSTIFIWLFGYTSKIKLKCC